MKMADRKDRSDGGSELIPIKIRRDTYRLIKTVAAWRGISALDYLDEIVKREATPDLDRVVEEIGELSRRKRGGP
jgi:hypothetical protein